ncbi:hypothetical protein [Limosilactobacillus antri]|uniref:hypothetical protein n=1 Tax=Limosilactobacillus antri TaxID=227943 RepID=UPI001F599BBF|nr:hypothetical protein [Limosilactobacillus antri]
MTQIKIFTSYVDPTETELNGYGVEPSLESKVNDFLSHLGFENKVVDDVKISHSSSQAPDDLEPEEVFMAVVIFHDQFEEGVF